MPGHFVQNENRFAMPVTSDFSVTVVETPHHRSLKEEELDCWTIDEKHGSARGTLNPASEKQNVSMLAALVAATTHELNNPLTGIIGMAQLMLQDAGMISRDSLDLIYREGLRCEAIIRNLAVLVQPFKPKKTPVCVKKLLEEIIADLAENRPDEQPPICFDFTASNSLVMADECLLKQAFQRLIQNALGSSAINQGQVIITAKQVDFVLRIEICDRGQGIHQDRLQNPFDRGFPALENSRESGMELSLCQGIIKAYGGRIYGSDNPGIGSTLAVELPVEEERGD
jgi:signal transduction histidine kinase